jgi:hypothetical protein
MVLIRSGSAIGRKVASRGISRGVMRQNGTIAVSQLRTQDWPERGLGPLALMFLLEFSSNWASSTPADWGDNADFNAL